MHHSLNIREHVIVPEPNYAISKLCQFFSSESIRWVLRMLSAIDFHDQTQLDTAKVHNKVAYRPLPSKLYAIDLAITHLSPKLFLRVGGCSAQFS
jgi:hypothetical protein